MPAVTLKLREDPKTRINHLAEVMPLPYAQDAALRKAMTT